MLIDPSGLDLTALRHAMSGRVSAPGDIDWNEARQAWNLLADQRPAAVAIPHSADDVIAVVAFARERACASPPRGRATTPTPTTRSPTRSSSRRRRCAA